MTTTNKTNINYLRSDNELQKWGNQINTQSAIQSTRIKQPFMEQQLTSTANKIGMRGHPDWRGKPCIPVVGNVNDIPFNDSQLRQDAAMGKRSYVNYYYRQCDNSTNTFRNTWNGY